MAKKSVGLKKRGEIYHIDKIVNGKRICMSTKETSLKRAEAFLEAKINEVKDAALFGFRKDRTFAEACEKYIAESTKSSLSNDVIQIKMLLPFIGGTFLKDIHNGSLTAFIKMRKKDGVKNVTINHGLKVVKHILNIATSDWFDENGSTWLSNSHKISMLKVTGTRKPRPITFAEQERLLDLLPEHLKAMVEFKVNTGTREQEVCNLKWEWEVKVPELNTSIFVVPEEFVKNRSDRVIVLNDIALEVVESRRGIDDEYVFTYEGEKILKMNNTAWKKARGRAELNGVRVHDLKHTFGRRLRAKDVSLEDRMDLLGHKSGKITTHYSAAEYRNLIEASNRVVGMTDSNSTIIK